MADELSVELIINDSKADPVIEKYKQKLQDFRKTTEYLSDIKVVVNGKAATSIDLLEAKSSKLRKTLDDVSKSADGKGFDSLSKSALDTSKRVGEINSQLSSLYKEMAKKPSKTILAQLQTEAKSLETELDSISTKTNRLNLGGADKEIRSSGGHGRGVFPRVRGFGQAFREFAPAGVNESEINTASQLAAIAGISATSLAAFGALVVAGGAFYEKTKSIREEAEKHLKVEENIQIAVNHQIITQQKAIENLQVMRQLAADNFNFQQSLTGDTLEDLQRKRDNLQKFHDVSNKQKLGTDKDGKFALVDNPEYDQQSQQLQALDAQIRAYSVNKTKLADDAFSKRFEDFKKSQDNAFQAEKKYRLDLAEKLPDLREALGSAFSQQSNNPIVKMMVDFDSATEKAKKQFDVFGDGVVNKIIAIEKANLTKAIGLQNFDNNFAALKYSQDARRLATTPESQFAPFQRAVDKFSMSVDFITKDSALSRSITENGYYINNYNPNNSKSFEEYNKRFFNDDTSSAGLQIRNAIEDIGKIKGLELGGTGVYGKGIAANQILSLLPSLDELVKRLNSPATRDDAQYLLSFRQQALFDSRESQRQKFEDSLQQSKNLEFGKQFAREQIDSINSDKTLTDAQKVQKRLSVTDALGNDLDPKLQQQRIKDFVSAANDKKNQEQESYKFLKDIHGYLKSLTEGKKPLPVDIGNQATFNLNVQTSDSSSKTSIVKTPTPADTANAYSGSTFYGDYEK